MVDDDVTRPGPAAGALIYPPPWYLDLVRARLHAVAAGWAAGDPVRRGPAPAAGAAGDDGGPLALAALAQEVLGLGGLDALPDRLRAFALGLDRAEVRRYLRGVQRERGRRPPAPAPARGGPYVGVSDGV